MALKLASDKRIQLKGSAMLKRVVFIVVMMFGFVQLNVDVWAESLNNLDYEPLQPLQAPEESLILQKKRALGKRLFHDVRLSGNNSVSCAHCHILTAGGVDGLPLSSGMKNQHTIRNTPTVFNVSLNMHQFWDGRAKDLKAQLDEVIGSSFEMNSDWPSIQKKLIKDRDYKKRFHALYDDGLTIANMKHALITFEESLITTGSRFDRYLKGDKQAINVNELKGYQIFKSYGCVACHQGANVGGNLFQKMGVFKSYFDPYAAEESDLGRFSITGK
ncbi:MAG: cytochrome c peroxidase, partial [Mariprofundaceae bacterium]|nr:cytochrome c peroxidase [Mariprofundaceae bacterium]